MALTEYRFEVSFYATALDRDRLERFIRRDLKARDLTIAALPSTRVSEARERMTREPKSVAPLVALFGARGVMRTSEFKHVPNARAALDRLIYDGRVEKIRHGIYGVAGSSRQALHTPRPQLDLGPRQQAIIDALDAPKTIAELTAIAGTSYQAVDQVLRRLIAIGMVIRRVGGEKRTRWVYEARRSPLVPVTNVAAAQPGGIACNRQAQPYPGRTRFASRTVNLLDIIARRPGSRATEISKLLDTPFENFHSIYVALTVLERRGLIVRRHDDDRSVSRWWPRSVSA